MSPMVTTSWTTSWACTSRRINVRSINAPNNGAMINTTKISATQAGQPRLIRTSQ